MPRKGRNLEKLVESLENYLIKEKDKIESPCFLKDYVTNKSREIDVLVRIIKEDKETLIAFECKDWSDKVGSPEVEAFVTKTRDMNIDKSCIVSSKGFSSPALKKAKHYKIKCLELQQINNFDWMLAEYMKKSQIHIIKNTWRINSHNKQSKSILKPKYIHSSGIEITKEIITENAKNYLSQIEHQNLNVGEIYRHKVPVNPTGIKIIDTQSKREYKVDECNMFLEFSLKVEEIPIQSIQMYDKHNEESLIEAAVSEVRINNEISGHFMFIEQEDGSKSLVFSKQSHPNK